MISRVFLYAFTDFFSVHFRLCYVIFRHLHILIYQFFGLLFSIILSLICLNINFYCSDKLCILMNIFKYYH
jgi:hypothetical protein